MAPTTDKLNLSGEPSLELNLLRAALNQVDYGMAVVVVDNQQLLFANGPAASALQPDGPKKSALCVTDNQLRTRNLADTDALHAALQSTKVGQRGLLQFKLAQGGDCTVAVMPLSTPGYALLVFSKAQLCDNSTVTLFARERGLTGAEGQVLTQLCKGLRPQQIATRNGVQVSTVRSQLRAIREKTSCDNMRELVERISAMPPISLQLSSTRSPMQFGLSE